MPSDEVLTRRQGRSRGLWIGYWVILFAVMHRPLPGGLGLPAPWLDKLIHVGVYFILAALGGWHQFRMGRGRRPGLLIGWVCVYGAYAALDEWLQQFVGRTASWGDWLADVAGVLAATIVLVLQERSAVRSAPAESAA